MCIDFEEIAINFYEAQKPRQLSSDQFLWAGHTTLKDDDAS